MENNSLGFCQSHEHLFIAEGQPAKVNPALKLDDFNKTLEELRFYKRAGGMSLVDAQPVGCGRMADYLYAASVESGINIIASTGFQKLIFYPENHWIYTFSEEQLADIFIAELTAGMYVNADNGIPKQTIGSLAGVIKTASDKDGITGKYKTLFAAAAKASVSTGTPVISHTEMGTGGLEQAELFLSSGIPADSIILCHLDRNLGKREQCTSVAEKGVFLEFDTIGRDKYHSDEDEMRFLAEMVSKGFEDRILLGLDTTRDRFKSYGGGLGLDFLMQSFLPRLRQYGLGEETIEKFMIKNPAKAFSKYGIKNQ